MTNVCHVGWEIFWPGGPGFWEIWEISDPGGFKILGNLSLPPSPDRSGCDLELSSADVSGEGGGQRYQFICGGHTPTRVWEEPIREESLYLPATQSVTELSKTDALLGVDVIPIYFYKFTMST